MTKKQAPLTMVLYALTLAAILMSSWLAWKWPEAINWIIGGLFGFAALLILVAILGARRKAA
jgi:hypothetical protein